MYKINIPVGVIESNCVNNVAMTLQCVKFFSRRCVPNFTCSIVTTSNEALKKQNCVILEKKKRVINLKRNLFHVINSESCNACCYWGEIKEVHIHTIPLLSRYFTWNSGITAHQKTATFNISETLNLSVSKQTLTLWSEEFIYNQTYVLWLI